MKNKLFKKSMSVFLSVLMLMTCWVFMPATHEHLTAEAAEDATAEYNASLVSGLTELSTSVSTMYGSFAGDTQNVTNEYYSQLYKNVLHTSQVTLNSTPAAQWKPSQWKDSNPADRIAFWHPTTVLLYDGSTQPQFGVVLEVDAANNIKIRSISAYIASNNNGLSWVNTYWKGHVTGRQDHAYLMFNGSDYLSTTGYEVSGKVFNTDSGAWWFLANSLKFTDTMSNTEYLRTINPTYGYIGLQASGDSNHTLTGSSAHSIYVINYVPVRNATNQVNTWLQTIKNNPGKYTTACVKSFVDLYNKMAAAHPNKYASATVNDPNGYNNAASTAMSAYNSFSLKTRSYDVTFENMFSISDWYNSASFGYDTTKGEILVENNKTVKIYKSVSSELTTGSSYSGNHKNTMYSMPVTGGKAYTVSFDITSSISGAEPKSEVFLFWYDNNNNPVAQVGGTSTFNNKLFTGNGNHTVTFTAPATAVKAEIRFDNDSASEGSTIRFNNIAVYPAERGTSHEIGSWTTRPVTKAYTSNASVGAALDVPARVGYDFNGWYLDNNGNGTMDDGEAVTDANGNVTNSFNVTSHTNLYADWAPQAMDVGYDNLFSLSAWAKTNASNPNNAANGTISYDLDAGTITVESTANGEVYTSYNTGDYTMDVEPSTEYVFEVDLKHSGTTKNGQMFIFCYDANGAATTNPGPVKLNDDGTETTTNAQHIGIYLGSDGTHTIKFRTPANCYKLRIRVGATDVGTKATYSNIGVYKLAAYDSYAKDYVKVREPFKYGDATVLMENPTREGFVFDGWELEDGTEITSTADLSASTTVYATWTKMWTVTYYDGDQKTVLATSQVKDGQPVGTLPSVTPTIDSDADYKYDFEYWYANGAKFTADTVVTENVSVYSTFKKTSHNFVWAENTFKDSTCTSPALVAKYCADCGYSLGNVSYDGDKEAWLAKGHEYTGGIITGSSTGNTDNDTHEVKCIRYSICSSTEEVKHTWENMGADGATCSVRGTVHWRCACLETKTTEGEFAPNVHVNTKTINAKEADCEEDGYTGDTYCNDCQKTVETGTTTGKLGHSFKNYTSDGNATCTEDGTKTAVCERCDATDNQPDEGSKLGHTWEDKGTDLVSAADCENDAVYYQTCKTCGISAKEDTTGTGSTWTKTGTKSGHDYTSTIRDNNDGTHSYLCANGCDTYGYNGVKEAFTACTYGDWDTTGDTQHVKTCVDCGYQLKEDHKFNGWTSTDEDKDAAGQHSKTCTICNKVVTENCTYTAVETKNTCTEDGYTTHTCGVCGHDYVTAGATKTGHNYTGEVKSLNDGTHYYLCKNGCNTYGFEEVENATAPCTYEYKNNKDGEHQVTCTACKYSFVQACSGGQATCTVPATCEKCKTAYGATAPHSFTGTAVKLEGDKHAYLCVYCSTEGLYGVGENQGYTQACSGGAATCTALAVCDVCKDTHGELKADAHKWGEWTNIEGTETHKRICEYNAAHTEEGDCFSPDIETISPDCETAGYTLDTCEFCGHEWHTNPTDPLDHDWSAWVDNGNGTHTRTCKDETCKYGENGGAKAETVACTKENATFVVTEPTCLDEGFTTYTCKDCGYEWVDDYTDATGHSYLEKTKKTDAKYQRTAKDCVTDWTYWYCCDNCDVSAETEADKYENEADLYWVREAAVGHKFDSKTATEDYLATEATCTAKATYYHSCSVCGTSSEGLEGEDTFESGSVLGHDWQNTEKFKKSDADCINNEVYYKECSRCHISSKDETNETWEKADTLSGHDFDYEGGYTEGVAANCTDTGVVEHYTCQTCGKHFKADQTTEIAADKLVIAALKHDFEDVAKKDATCEEDGYTTHKQCQREDCGYRNSDYEVIPAAGHDFKAENGYYCDTVYFYHAYYCSRYDECGAYGVDNVKYSVDTSGLDPEIKGGIKCEFDGEYVNYEDANGAHSHKLICECGNITSDVCVDAEPVHIAPTCTEDGYYIHTCDVCGFVWEVASDAEEDEATGHDFVGAAWTKVEGKDEHTRKCNDCDVTETEACATANPSTSCGTMNTCDKCFEAFGEQIPHQWTESKEEAYLKDAATCETDAVYYKKCTSCDTKDEKQIWIDKDSATGHKMTEYGYDITDWKNKPEGFNRDVKAPTCSAEGLAISYCENCDYYVTKHESKNEELHDYGEETAVGGNCATGITYKKTCKNCGKSLTRVDNNVDHEYVLQLSKEATCTQDSVELYTCKNCGFSKETHENEKLGHSWENGEQELVIDKEATCQHAGRGYYICTVCNAKSENEVIEKLAHAWDKNNDGLIDDDFAPDAADNSYIYVEATSATCSADGYEGYFKCLDCSYDQHRDERWLAIEGNFKPATGHVDTDGDGECDGLGCNKDLADDSTDGCGCICHKTNWFSKIIYKILRFFWKLFGIGKSCGCGTVHY